MSGTKVALSLSLACGHDVVILAHPRSRLANGHTDEFVCPDCGTFTYVKRVAR